jgi:YidC/Oxa1 family membrane protein insertase
MSSLFNEILYKPLFNALIGLYNTVALEDLGLAIIFLTIFIRVVFFPLFHASLRHQRLTQELQPHIKEIQKKHKDNKEAQTKAVLELYAHYKANPLTPIILILVQLPVLFVLFKIFNGGVTQESLSLLYSFVHEPKTIHYTLLGLIDLGEKSFYITALATGLQYLQSKLSLPPLKPGQELNQAEKIGRNMVYIGPVITAVVLFNLPAAIGLYWLTTTIFSIFQQVIVNKLFSHGGLEGATK